MMKPMSRKKEDILHVAMCSDCNYGLRHLGPFFRSLRDAHPGVDIRICYLVAGDVERMKDVGDCCKRLGMDVVFHDVLAASEKAGFFNWCNPDTHFTPATFCKLLIPDFVEKNVDRVVYLDPDTIVVSDLREFLSGMGSGVALGVVRDDLVCHLRREDLYFNAGVLGISLSVWRNKQLSEKMIAHLEMRLSSGAKFQYGDQDLMNDYFAVSLGSSVCVQYMDARWNLQTNRCPEIEAMDEYFGRIGMAGRFGVFHFCGGVKPWDGPCEWMRFQKYPAIAYWRAMVPDVRVLGRIRQYLSRFVYGVLVERMTRDTAGWSKKKAIAYRLGLWLHGRQTIGQAMDSAWRTCCGKGTR